MRPTRTATAANGTSTHARLLAQRFARRVLAATILSTATVLLLVASGTAAAAPAETTFQDLIAQLPRSTNAVVILNVEKIKRSPLAVKEKWADNLEKAFQDGMVRIPPHATRFVVGSELDLEFMSPIYETAIAELDKKPSLERIVKEYGGTVDKLENLDAVALRTDTYVIQLAPQTLGVMRPGNRQAVLRWIKDIQSPKSAISPYLQRAAGFSDTSGSEIIMAIDLAGGFSWERAAKYLNGKPELLKKYGAEVNDAATVLRSVEGVRVGIRLGDEPFAKIVLDFPGGVKASPEAAKELLLEIFADLGVKLDEFDQWKCEVTPKEVSLSGTLSREGLRRMNSLIDSPAPANVAADGDKYVSPGETAGDKAAASVRYYQTVSKMFDDIKKGWRDLNNIASGAGFLDRYAARIDKLPVLNVDEDLLDYGQYVSTQLRAGANAVRTLGIRGGAREAQVTGYDVGPSVVGYGGDAYGGYYGGYRSGWVAYDYPSGHDVIKQVDSERRKIRAEEKGVMATNVYAIRDQILDATAKIRRAMSERYQTEF
ncbi:MAG: hypothetical protein NTW96_06005 [Planctomycetia bacterium]|nr:hypothetical protein [Planctomycetia bacterium]